MRNSAAFCQGLMSLYYLKNDMQTYSFNTITEEETPFNPRRLSGWLSRDPEKNIQLLNVDACTDYLAVVTKDEDKGLFVLYVMDAKELFLSSSLP